MACRHYAGTIANRQNPELHDVACEALRCDMEGLQEALLQHLHVRTLNLPMEIIVSPNQRLVVGEYVEPKCQHRSQR